MNQSKTSDGFIARGGMWVVGQAILFCVVFLSPAVWPLSDRWHSRWHKGLGELVLVCGAALLLAGFLELGTSLTPMPSPSANSMLKTNGAYRLVRHPIYGGLVLAMVGYTMMLPAVSELALGLLALLFFDRKASREEIWLRQRYPDYADYASARKKLVPWLY